MPDCISKDTVLRQPQESLRFPDDAAQETPPFVLKGSPMSNRPQSVVGLSAFRRKPSATTDTKNREAYFAQDQYYEMRLATEHILQGDPNTTLRFDNRNYSLRFGCLHRQLWQGNGLANGAHFSLLFTTSDGAFFHICIPLEFTGTPENENIFLKYWLYNNPGGNLPSGFTVNESLNTRQEFTKYATLQYCLFYNGQRNISSYTFCLFKTPLKINKTQCPSWLQNDVNFTAPQQFPNVGETFKTWRPQTFDQIFNIMLRGTVRKYIYDEADPYLASDEEHFDLERTQAVIQPSYFKTKTQELAGKLFAQPFRQLPSGVKGLKNVKCYPIDLASQIDDEGNIYVDESTNKPIDIAEASGQLGDAGFPNKGSLADAKKQQDYIKFIVIFLAVFLVLGCVVILLIVFVFKGKTISGVEPVVKNMAEAGAAVGEAGAAVGEAGAAVGGAAVAGGLAAAKAATGNLLGAGIGLRKAAVAGAANAP